MSPRPTVDTPPRPLEVAIVGNDAVLAALPARPMQLAHAVLACGYDLVVPVSWGEEVVAEHALRAISARGSAPAIFCACPSLRGRLLSAGNELAPYLISVVAPSVATARYLRALDPHVPMRISMIGGCPSGRDAAIDTRIDAHDFLRLLVNRGISLTRQPAVFDSVIPPDRRRFFSLPGGCPAPKALETRAPDRRLVTITDDAFSTELAELLLGGENVLVDLSPRLGCTCCGGPATGDHWGPSGREEIIQLEPPRALSPILDLDVEVPVDVAPTDPVSQPERGGRADRIGRATADTLRLPGAAPIGQARLRAEQRAERHRIAVTPPTAMPASPVSPVSPVSPAPKTSIPVATTRADAPAAVRAEVRADVRAVAPTGGLVATTGTPAVPPPVAPPLRTPTATIARNPSLSAPELHPHAGLAGTYADLGGFSARDAGERPRSVAAPRHEAPPLLSPVDLTLDEAPREGPPRPVVSPSVAAPAPAAVAAVGDGDVPVTAPPAVEPEVARSRSRRGSSHRFLLSRASHHPRAQAGDGKVLPRAYIRHTPGALPVVAVDLPVDAAVDARDDVGAPEVERPLDRSVESPAPRARPAADTASANPHEPIVRVASPERPAALDLLPSTDTVEASTAAAPSDHAELVSTELTEVAAFEAVVEAVVAEATPTEATPAEAMQAETIQAETMQAAAMPREAQAAPPEETSSPDLPPVALAAEADEQRALVAEAVAPVATINEELLARLRHEAQRHHARHPARVVSRQVPPPPTTTPVLGSIVRFVLVVAVLVVCAVGLAIILRRAPTAPW